MSFLKILGIQDRPNYSGMEDAYETLVKAKGRRFMTAYRPVGRIGSYHIFEYQHVFTKKGGFAYSMRGEAFWNRKVHTMHHGDADFDYHLRQMEKRGEQLKETYYKPYPKKRFTSYDDIIDELRLPHTD